MPVWRPCTSPRLWVLTFGVYSPALSLHIARDTRFLCANQLQGRMLLALITWQKQKPYSPTHEAERLSFGLPYTSCRCEAKKKENLHKAPKKFIKMPTALVHRRKKCKSAATYIRVVQHQYFVQEVSPKLMAHSTGSYTDLACNDASRYCRLRNTSKPNYERIPDISKGHVIEVVSDLGRTPSSKTRALLALWTRARRFLWARRMCSESSICYCSQV